MKQLEKRLFLKISHNFTAFILFCALCLLFFISLNLGTYSLSWQQIQQTFANPHSEHYFTLVEYRLPRALLAISIGGALAVSGVLVQTLVKNPLSSPDILGINNAAGLASIICVIFLPNLTFYWLPLFAFIGGLLSFIILWLLCGLHFHRIKIAIVGIALSTFWAALSHYIMLSNPININSAILWLTGSLWGRSWSYLTVAFPYLVTLLILSLLLCRQLDALALGEPKAITLGIPTTKIQIIVLFIAVALSSIAVAICGPISFLGLMSPHLARHLVGGKHRILLPTAFLIGALLLLLSDILARAFAPPLELPAGLLTAILGAPYFFYLLMRTKS